MNPLPKLKDGLAALLECRVEVEKREFLWPLFFDDSVVIQILTIIPFCQNLLDPRCPWTPGATARPIAPMINQKESQHDPARGGSARFPRMRSSKLDFLSKFPSTSDIMNVVRHGSERRGKFAIIAPNFKEFYAHLCWSILLPGTDASVEDLSSKIQRNVQPSYATPISSASFVYNLFAILIGAGAFVKAWIPPEFAGLGGLVSVSPVIAAAVLLRFSKVYVKGNWPSVRDYSNLSFEYENSVVCLMTMQVLNWMD